MPDGAFHDDGPALDHANNNCVEIRSVRIVEGEQFTDDPGFAAERDKITLVRAVNHHVLKHPQRPFDGWSDAKPSVASPTEHATPLHGSQKRRGAGTRV